MHDAIRLLSMAIREYAVFTEIETESEDCADPSQWEHGQSLLKMIDERKTEGISGRLSFDENFDRLFFTMDVLELSLGETGLQKIAFWDSVHGISVTRTLSDVYTQISQSLQNRTLIVASRVGLPFLRWKYVSWITCSHSMLLIFSKYLYLFQPEKRSKALCTKETIVSKAIPLI